MEKHQCLLRSFILAAMEYTKDPSEASVSVLQRKLGSISVSLDLSIFNPGSSVAAEFYVCLHKLINSLESTTHPLVWSALSALENACRNTAARQAVLHIYKFGPILTRLLEINLTLENQVKVLILLEKLTHGVKFPSQEAHLSYLISPLTQRIMQSKDEDVIALSLGILVNVCYKNLPAVYTLMRTIDTKTFLRTLLEIQCKNVNTRVQCCKMMIILEDGNNKDITEKHIIEFITTTFAIIVSALANCDSLLLRHVVDFFNDFRQIEHSRKILLNYPRYTSDVKDILESIQSDSDPECVSLIMEFLQSLVSLKLSSLVILYPMCVKVAMTWVPVEQVCSKALALVRAVTIDSRSTNSQLNVLADLDFSVLMLVANCANEDNDEDNDEDDETTGKSEKDKSEMESRLTELMKLLQEIAKIPSLRYRVSQAFGEQEMRKLLRTMLEHDDTSGTSNWPRKFNDPATILHVHALALTAVHATHDSAWLTLYSEVLQKKQVQTVLALALFTGDSEVKEKVLQLASSVGFSEESVVSVADCMSELGPLVLVQNFTDTMSTIVGTFPTHSRSAKMTPFFSSDQEYRLDTFLTKLEEAFDKNQTENIATSAIMELYDYKLAAMRHAERATQASLEAANNYATSLRHRLAQLVAESSRLHQLLFHNQQCLEEIRYEKATLTTKIKAQIQRLQEIPRLRTIIEDKTAAMERENFANAGLKRELEASTCRAKDYGKKIVELKGKHSESEAKSMEMQSRTSELKEIFFKLQGTVDKKDHAIEELEREIAKNRDEISSLEQRIEQLVSQCRTYERKIAEREENVQELMSELEELKRMRDMICNLTMSKREVEDTRLEDME